jgi:hypothetical protein
MERKTKHLRIRITEEQFKKLADNLVIEQRTKSSLMRDILCNYLDMNYKRPEKQNKIAEGKERKLNNVDEIFPIVNRTVEETQFVDRCLVKMKVDLEAKVIEDIILSPQQLIFLLQGIIRGWDNFKEKAKKKN